MPEPMPTSLEPMLATPAKTPPAGEGWAFELKWDGVRALVFADGGETRISARRGAEASFRYPELAGIGAALGGRAAILDGEIVAFDEAGEPSFGLLQRRMGLTDAARVRQRSAETPVTYVAFDLLWLDGRLLLDEPYERRRELLAELELDHKQGAVPSELSRGMRQKLMIACGFLHDPALVLLDEPLTGLDPLAIRKMKKSIEKRAQEGAAVVLSSHLLPLVEELCDRVCVIARGRVRALGTLDAIRAELGRGQAAADPTLEELFVRITEEVDAAPSERQP